MAKKQKNQEIDVVLNELEQLNRQSADYAKGSKKKGEKKTLLILCIALVVVLLGGIIAGVIVSETQSPVSYGPNALASEKTEERTAEHERRLKSIDENGGIREGVNFVGYHARFNEDGDLVVDGYMRNFTGHEIYDIDGNITVKTQEDDNIGGAYFEFPKEEFGTLKNGKSRPWRLIFDNDYVNIEIVDLSSFKVLTELYFKQK